MELELKLMVLELELKTMWMELFFLQLLPHHLFF